MSDFCTCDEFAMDDREDSFGFLSTDAPFPLPVDLGGTGADNAADARDILGLGTAAVADIDATLTIQGDAADANATGLQTIAAAYSASRYLMAKNYGYLGQTTFGVGGINDSGGFVTNAKRARSLAFSNTYASISVPVSGSLVFFFYSSTTASASTFSEKIGPFRCGDGITVPVPQNNSPYFRVMLTKSDGSTFSTNDISSLNSGYALFDFSDISKKLDFANSAIEALFNEELISSSGYYTITIGSYRNPSTGALTTDAKYARTFIMGVSAHQKRRVVCPEGYGFSAVYYSSSSSTATTNYVSGENPRTAGNYIIDPPENSKGVVYNFYALDRHDLTSEDAEAIQNSFKIFRKSVPDELTIAPTATSRAAFVSYMAEMCENLGMTNTVFANASGLTRDSSTTPLDELKMALAVAGNPKALDIWSTRDREFTIGGEHARTVEVINNVYSLEPEGAYYKLLGGKGGSLQPSTEDNHYRKARVGIYNVSGQPVIVSLSGPDEWVYNNIAACTQDLLTMMDAEIHGYRSGWTNGSTVNFRAEPNTSAEIIARLPNGTTLIVEESDTEWTKCRVGAQIGYVSTPLVSFTPIGNISSLLNAGGGYSAIPCPVCAGAYLNSYSAADLLGMENALAANQNTSQIPASTTKTMTMLCALSIATDLQELISLASVDISSGSGSTFYEGDTLTLEDALRIMMMESSNTMAEAIGRFIGSKITTNQALRDQDNP